MVRAVERAGAAGDGFEKIGAPDRPVDDDRLRRVDLALGGICGQQAHLEADAALGTLLAWSGAGVDEVQVAHRDADLVEAEHVQHA